MEMVEKRHKTIEFFFFSFFTVEKKSLFCLVEALFFFNHTIKKTEIHELHATAMNEQLLSRTQRNQISRFCVINFSSDDDVLLLLMMINRSVSSFPS